VDSPRGRGAVDNPPNRFEPVIVEPDPDCPPEERPAPETRFYKDSTRDILSRNDSPDVPFDWGLNPYRGCEHGCSYCYARPFHEYLGFSAGLDFETRIMVKTDAAALLRKRFLDPKWEPAMVSMSGVTDAYQPVERRLRIARACLEVFAEFLNPVAIVTKNALVARDADLLSELSRHRAAAVFVSLTTLDAELARRMEPRASRPGLRLEAIETLAKAGVNVGVMTAPVVPGLTDHELPALLKAAAGAGARFASYVLLRLPLGVEGIFSSWLERHYPARKKKVLSQLGEMRGGRLNDPRFGKRMRGEGPIAQEISALFKLARRKAGMSERGPELSTAAFRRPAGPQLELF